MAIMATKVEAWLKCRALCEKNVISNRAGPRVSTPHPCHLAQYVEKKLKRMTYSRKMLQGIPLKLKDFTAIAKNQTFIKAILLPK